QRREVNLRHRVIEEERLPIGDAALHERDALLDRLTIDGAARGHVERLHVARWRSGRPFPDERRAGSRLPLRDRGLRFVAGAWDAVILVESLLRGVAPFGTVTAEMPLAEETGRVADGLERL